MSKTAIVYKSKYGHTKQYALWLKEDVQDSDLISFDKCTADELAKYDLIVFLGCVYHGKIGGISFFNSNYSKLKHVKTVIIAVGGFQGSEERLQNLLDENFNDLMKKYCKLIQVQGDIDLSRLSFPDKIAAKIEKKKINASGKIHSEKERSVLELFEGITRNTDKEKLSEAIEYINSDKWKLQ